jgi:uncharacterized protein YjbI with pentapeptide repeats
MERVMSVVSKRIRFPILVTAAIFALLITHLVTNGQPVNAGEHDGPYKNMKLSIEELRKVHQAHAEWLKTYEDKYYGEAAQKDKRMADLSGADLSGAKLGGAHLNWANLNWANLSGAKLSGADLIGASLRGASLSGADLSWVDLRRASLFEANLSGANLSRADLRGASLFGADLRGADLKGADLSKADLSKADLNHLKFEPKTLPDSDYIASASNLALMYYVDSPEALFKLRKMFKEAGFYEQERKVTYAIKHCETMKALHVRHWRQIGIATFEGMFHYIFFDRTTLWGMVPTQALLVLLGLIPAFMIPYAIVLKRPGKNGIWRIWSHDRVRADVGTEEPIRLYVGWRQAFGLGLYFSVLSAFNIGWRDLNVGNWIQRLQPNEYTLRATGWMRTVSGVQALISVYLLAIWVLTYFGRPFE